ncbi:orc1/cdc6 family replication initiation protein [Halarchaeum nitratireducens]|uniref:ORC1-type DNA replication protein n=1 Tax=Halarchaeum nitratireducens TaxID=489913 RepID=A0A830GEH9_9EURY|nr:MULTISPECIES: orc1/cdc6 family replication initiation protein [Halarchaeum]MBP2252632.1 cell division control protein 6 [Halarchaeum solikamskense]GGN23631.1 cell division control protein Cdc6 [Halarchaeum nitratireducens]
MGKAENPFTSLNEIWANRDVLHEDYTPTEILERESERDKLAAHLAPVANGNRPNNIFLYGKTGVGKTVVTEYMLGKLDEFKDPTVDLSVVTLNCQNCSSSYQVAVALVNELHDETDQISPTGYPAETVYQYLYDELDQLGGTVLVVLDEIDAIGDDDGLLYELPRARSKGDVENVKLGVIGISNDLEFKKNLSSKVKSTLCEKELVFTPYDATELQTIVMDRAESAFLDDVVQDGVIEHVAAIAAKNSGDARQAIRLLREAGDLAKQSESGAVVTDDIVEAAKEELEASRIERAVDDLPLQTKLATLTLAFRTEASSGPIRTAALHDTYCQIARENGVERRSHDAFRDQLDDLDMLGIALRHRHNEGRGGGIYYTWESDIAYGVVRDVLDELNTP